jgi:hypothetical protein
MEDRNRSYIFYKDYNTVRGARDGAVGWGTALQAGRSRVRFPIVSLEFFIDNRSRPNYGPRVDSASNRNEYQEYLFGERRPMRRADNLTTFMCRLSWNLGASNSWNPQGLSRPIMWMLHLILVGVVYRIWLNVMLKRHSTCIFQLDRDNCWIVWTTHIRRKNCNEWKGGKATHGLYSNIMNEWNIEGNFWLGLRNFTCLTCCACLLDKMHPHQAKTNVCLFWGLPSPLCSD